MAKKMPPRPMGRPMMNDNDADDMMGGGSPMLPPLGPAPFAPKGPTKVKPAEIANRPAPPKPAAKKPTMPPVAPKKAPMPKKPPMAPLGGRMPRTGGRGQ